MLNQTDFNAEPTMTNQPHPLRLSWIGVIDALVTISMLALASGFDAHLIQGLWK